MPHLNFPLEFTREDETEKGFVSMSLRTEGIQQARREVSYFFLSAIMGLLASVGDLVPTDGSINQQKNQ